MNLTPRQRQMAILGALLVVWGGLLAELLLGSDPPKRVPLVNVSGLPRGTSLASNKAGTEVLRVHLAQLKQSRAQRAAASPTAKNIFELERREGTPVELPPPPPVDLEPEIPEPTAGDMQSESAWAELGQFRYLGYLELGDHGRKREEIAMLAARDVLHTVRRGEIIGSGILVAAITPTTVVLRHTESQIEQELSLTDDGP